MYNDVKMQNKMQLIHHNNHVFYLLFLTNVLLFEENIVRLLLILVLDHRIHRNLMQISLLTDCFYHVNISGVYTRHRRPIFNLIYIFCCVSYCQLIFLLFAKENQKRHFFFVNIAIHEDTIKQNKQKDNTSTRACT